MKLDRLFYRIYLWLLVAILLTLGLAGVISHHLLGAGVRSPFTGRLAAEARHVARALPPADRSADEQLAALRPLAQGLELEVAVFDSQQRLIGTTTPRLGVVRWGSLTQDWVLTNEGPAHPYRLDDGRFAVFRPRDGSPHHTMFVASLLLLFVGLAVASYPVARRLTRRLEALERGVRRFGAGELSARVSAEGSDEVARLAESFNWTAARIERLIESQRRTLAHASHELRSPLARLRMLLELIREHGDTQVSARVDEAAGEIGALDELVEDVLLSSRIEAGGRGPLEEVDLDVLLREEAARNSATLELQPVRIVGEARALRRLVRNLLDNAQIHGGGAAVTAGVAPLPDLGGARVWVADRGPGIAPEDCERVFEPFYQSPQRGAPSARGVGLGLALVREIAAHHGGRAVCRPREGGGTLVEVVLRATPPTEPTMPSPR